jgi:RNA polymerase sigma-70 factor (ECF subfamily)
MEVEKREGLEQDRIWVQQSREGDLEAFDRLVLKYQDRIYGTALQIVGNREDAYDIAQETFMKAYTKLHTFRQEAAFSTWLIRIAMNLAKSKLRWRKLRNFIPFIQETQEGEEELQVPDKGPGPEEILMQREFQDQLRNALERLPEEYREAIILRDIQGLSYDEIAGILGIQPGTVKSRINRGRIQLRKELGEDFVL